MDKNSSDPHPRRICVACNAKVIPYIFTVIIKTEDPKIYELKKINCGVCENCNTVYIEDELDAEIVAICKQLDNILNLS